jgi:Fe(3+) dicitrate transport protein
MGFLKRLAGAGAAALTFLPPLVAFAQAAPEAKEQAEAPAEAPKAEAPAAPETKPALPERPPGPPPEEVSIVGTRISKVAGSVHVIDKKQLQRFEYDDPTAVLQSVPGVYVRGEDGLGLRPNIGLRGTNSDRSKKVTLMEDGVLFGPAPYSAPAAYYFPLITRMKSVRVIKGPGAVAFGPQTVGGAVDLITEDIPSKTAGFLDLATGDYNYNKIHGQYGYSNEHVGFLIEGVHLGTSGFKTLDYVGGNTGYSHNEWMVKGNYTLDPTASVQHDFSIKLGYSDETSNETYLGLTDDDFRAAPYRRYVASELDKMQWTRTTINLAHKARFQNGLEITTTIYRNDLHRIWRKVNGFRDADLRAVLADPTSPRNAVYYNVLTGKSDATTDGESILVGPNDRTFVSQGVQSVARMKVRSGPIEQRIEYGMRFHYDEIVRHHTQNGFRMVSQGLVPDGQPTQTTADNTASTYAMAAHAVDAITWGNLTVTPGLRFELISSRLEDRLAGTVGTAAKGFLLPGVGAFYGLTRDFGILAGAYKGFSPPQPGVAASKEESSVNYEAGARYSSRAFRAEVIGFFNDYSNITDLCSVGSGCSEGGLDTQYDGGAAHIYGLEAYLETAPKVGGGFQMPMRVSYTFTQTEFLTDFVSGNPLYGTVRAGDEMAYIPKNQLTGSLGIETRDGGYGINASVAYISPMREQAGQGDAPKNTMTDESFVVDMSGSARLLTWLKLYANVRNLTGGQYLMARQPFGARPNAPRWFQVGLKAEF